VVIVFYSLDHMLSTCELERELQGGINERDPER